MLFSFSHTHTFLFQLLPVLIGIQFALGPRITMLICFALSPLSLPTHKDLEVQAENRWIEPVGFVAQGWRQAGRLFWPEGAASALG